MEPYKDAKLPPKACSFYSWINSSQVLPHMSCPQFGVFFWQRVIGIAKFRSIVPLSPHSYQKERVTDKFTSSCQKYVLPCLLVRKFSLLIVILAIVALHCWRPYQYSPSGPMNCRQSQARAVVGRNCYVSFELIRFLQVFQYTATAVHQQKPLQLSRSIN